MPNYRITFSAKMNSDICRSYDVTASDSDAAFAMAYKMPEAKRVGWNISVMEIPDGPKAIGIRFSYMQLGRMYSQYLFVRAEDEEQAKKYYRKNIQGKHFYQPWPDKPTESGNCVYGTIQETYFAVADPDSCPFDATNTN